MILRILGFSGSSSGRKNTHHPNRYPNRSPNITGFEDLKLAASLDGIFADLCVGLQSCCRLPKIVPTTETTSRITPHLKYQSIVLLQYNDLTKKPGMFEDQHRLMSNEVVASTDNKNVCQKVGFIFLSFCSIFSA